MAELETAAADVVPWSAAVTDYDEAHTLTYVRLLVAEEAGVDWREGVRHILRRDPVAEPERSQRCWESHLERARWMNQCGYLFKRPL
ncbi:MAG: DUF2285 domain-containing protein [Azospirillum sp.]|nr:DUF2285 domain-containing protein [Azospirillum sp.]